MDHLKLFKRAATIALKYRALWLFGFLLALFGGSGGGGGGGGGRGASSPSGGFPGDGNFGTPFDALSAAEWTTVLAVAGVLVLVVFVLALLGVVVRAVSRSALIGMVDQIETDGETTIRDGWRFGWSGRAWRVFLVGLTIGLPKAILLLGLLLPVAAPLTLGFIDDTWLVIGIILAIGLFALWLIFALLLSVVLSPVVELGWRYTALPQAGVIDSLKASIGLLRSRFKDVAVTVVLLIGAAFAWGIISFIITLMVLIVAAIVAAIPGGIAYLLTEEALIGVLAALPFFLIVLVLPLAFVGGLYLIFRSAVWTLLFRELTTEEEVIEPDSAPDDEVDAADPPLVVDGQAEELPADESPEVDSPDEPEA